MLEDLISERRKKLEKLKQAGIDPYPLRVKRTALISEALGKFAALLKSKKKISVAGRLLGLRDQGNLIFADIEDASGRIQAVLKRDDLKDFALWKDVLDRGDFVSVTGTIFKTKRGEKSIAAREVQMLAKSLRPLPSTWYGLEETEGGLPGRDLDP